MTIPALMIFLSVALSAKVNRWANIIIAKLYIPYTLINGILMMQEGSSTLMESWKKISANEYAGKSRLIKNRDSTLGIALMLSFNHGVINYLSTVAGQNDGKAVVFTITKADNNSFVPENP